MLFKCTKLHSSYDHEVLRFVKDGVTFYRPVTLEQLKTIKSDNPNSKCVVGNSEVGSYCWLIGMEVA